MTSFLSDATVGAAFLELPDGASADVAPAGKVRIRNNGGQLEVSEDAGDYVDAVRAVSAYDTLAAAQSTTSATFVDITGLTVSVPIDGVDRRIVAVMTFGAQTTGGGSNAAGEWTISINSVDGDANERFLSGTNDMGIGAVIVRSAVLAAGASYTVVGRHRRASGDKTLQTTTGQLFAMVVAA